MELEDDLVAHDTFRVPRAYWKVVVAGAPGGRVRRAAFLMHQVAMVAAGVGRQIDLADYRVPLERLEQTARLRFPRRLRDGADLDQ